MSEPADIIDRIWRDWHRRRIDHTAFNVAFRTAIAVLRERNNERISAEAAVAQLQAIHTEALRHPVPPAVLPPLRPDEVGMEEVMAALWRVIAVEAEVIVEQPWTEVRHMCGLFEINGWKFSAFKRSYGVKYINEVTAPDG